VLCQQHHGEEWDGHERELLERERGAEARGRPHEPAAREEPEGEDEREQRGSVGSAEPRALEQDRIRGQAGTDGQAHVQGSGEDERRR